MALPVGRPQMAPAPLACATVAGAKRPQSALLHTEIQEQVRWNDRRRQLFVDLGLQERERLVRVYRVVLAQAGDSDDVDIPPFGLATVLRCDVVLVTGRCRIHQGRRELRRRQLRVERLEVGLESTEVNRSRVIDADKTGGALH